jgi:hypothetical protein
MYATIQTLLNDWRSSPDERDITRLAKFEHKAKDWLLTEKKVKTLEESKDDTIDPLVLRLMTEKLNRKYSNTLSREQKAIIHDYVLSMNDDDVKPLKERLERMRSDTLHRLDEYLCAVDNQVLNEKADRIRNDVLSVTTEQFDDETITKFLTIAQLRQTLLEEDVS